MLPSQARGQNIYTFKLTYIHSGIDSFKRALHATNVDEIKQLIDNICHHKQEVLLLKIFTANQIGLHELLTARPCRDKICTQCFSLYLCGCQHINRYSSLKNMCHKKLVVMQLTEKYLKKSRNITTNYYFSFIVLYETLMSNSTSLS